MAKKDDRKKQKKRLKEQKKSAARSSFLAARKRATLYPRILVDPTGGHGAFVSTVRDIVSGFDYDDPDICPPLTQKILQSFHSFGFTESLRRLRAVKRDAAQKGFDADLCEETILDPILLHLGTWIFGRLPEECRVTPLPFYYFFVLPADRDLVIRFAFMPSASSPNGRVYYSPFEPSVQFGGGNWKVGFFRHAIERVCQRICMSPSINYAHFNACALYFRSCVYFEPLELPDGQHAIRLFERCYDESPTDPDPYISTLLGPESRPSKQVGAYRLLGYCPVAFIGLRAVAKTFLFPGYGNTPEDHLVRTTPMSVDQRRRLVEIASNNRTERVFRQDGMHAIKWYHDHGVPQIRMLPREVFAPPRDDMWKCL